MTSLELTIESPDDSSTRQIVVAHFPFRIGRALQNDLPMPFLSVSGNHLCIESAADATVEITDLNSTNGTFVDDRRVPAGATVTLEMPVRLRIGDVFTTIRRFGDGPPDGFTLAQSSTELRKMVHQAASSGDDIEETLPFFEVLNGPDTGRRVRMEPKEQPVTLGTTSEAELTIDVPGFPARLATICWRDDRCLFTPAAAGIESDGRPLEDHRQLRSGDRLNLGSVELLFYDPLEQELEMLQSGIHQRKTRPPTESPVADDIDEPDGTDDTDETNATDGPDSPPEQPATDTGAEPEDLPETTEPADERASGAPTAGFGAIELFLLIMSVVFLLATVAMILVFLT